MSCKCVVFHLNMGGKNMKKKLKMLLLLLTTCVMIVSGANVTTSYASEVRMRQGHTGAHTWVQTFRKNATCTAYGCVQYKCYCGKTKKQAIKPLGHNYSVARHYPTYFKEGYNIFTCRRCGHKVRTSMGKPKLQLNKPEIIFHKRISKEEYLVRVKNTQSVCNWYLTYNNTTGTTWMYPKSSGSYTDLKIKISEGYSCVYSIYSVYYRGNGSCPTWKGRDGVKSNPVKVSISGYLKPNKVSGASFSYNHTTGTNVKFNYDTLANYVQIDYCLNSNFKGGVKRVEAKLPYSKASTSHFTVPIGFLKSGKYYVRMKVYRVNPTVYGDWYYTTMTVK